MKQKIIKLIVQTIITFIGALCAIFTSSCSFSADFSRYKSSSPNPTTINTPSSYGFKVTRDSIKLDSLF